MEELYFLTAMAIGSVFGAGVIYAIMSGRVSREEERRITYKRRYEEILDVNQTLLKSLNATNEQLSELQVRMNNLGYKS